MDGNQSQTFSDIPALGDAQGLQTYLQNEMLGAMGGGSVTPQVTPTQPETPAVQQTQEANPAQPAVTPTQVAVQPTAQPQAQPAQPAGTVNLTQEQLIQLAKAVQGVNTAQQPQVAPTQNVAYSDNERAFITQALAKGYSLDAIQTTIMNHRNGNQAQNNELSKRVNEIQQYLQQQEYKQAETAFINKLSSFGEKFGLSENDLVTFGNEAFNKGINIATPNVDLETVFRAIYPEQYRIRSQRMSPTNSSQIYGGTSIPESGNRGAASKLEDAYVENFLKQAMPNQFQMNNKN